MRKRSMYIAAGVIALAFVFGLAWLVATVDDWRRDLTTNVATTSASAKQPSLHPIISERPLPELAELVATAAKQLRGWELVSRQETTGEATLRFIRATPHWRFKDDITVHIQPAQGDDPSAYKISAESQSRIGYGDFGQNPRNLAELMDMLRTLLR